jgi:hypothetical protein
LHRGTHHLRQTIDKLKYLLMARSLLPREQASEAFSFFSLCGDAP